MPLLLHVSAGGQTPQSLEQSEQLSVLSQIPSPQKPLLLQSIGQVLAFSLPEHFRSPQKGLAAIAIDAMPISSSRAVK